MIPLKGLNRQTVNFNKKASISKHGDIVKHFEMPVIAKGDKQEIKNIVKFLHQRYK